MRPIQEIALRYGDATRSLCVPEANLLAVVEPKTVAAQAPAPLIAQALDNPVGSPPLPELVHSGNKVIILVDDNTRPTPAYLLLPALLARLAGAGVDRDDITILMAGGSHRPMNHKEIAAKVGCEVQKQYRVLNHRWMDADALVTIGCTSSGVPVQVNRLIVESDFCLGVGDISPHPLAGWSGGAKLLQPGACGALTTAATHGRMADYPPLSFLGDENSPIRLEIERVARSAGLRFIVNTVLDAEAKVAGVFAGDPVAAHRAGVAFARSIWTASVPSLADIVVASSHPADIDFWQAQKTLHFMECVVKRGGDLILLTPCPEGLSGEPHHGQVIARYARLPAKQALMESKRAGEWDRAAVNTAVHVAMTRELADITLVSDGLGADDCRALGLHHSSNLNEALDQALAKHGENAKVLVLTQGPKVIPLCQS